MERAATRSLLEIDELPLRSSDRRQETDPGRENSRKRLLFVIAHLGPGGAQRVAVNAAKALVKRGFDVHIVVIHHRPDTYQLDPRVVIQSRVPRQAELATLDNDPDDAEPTTAKAAAPKERGGCSGWA